LQQDFDWLVSIPKEKVIKESNNMELCFEEEKFDDFLKKLKSYGVRYLGEVVEQKMVVKRFLSSGLSMEETAKRMDVSLSDLEKLMNS